MTGRHREGRREMKRQTDRALGPAQPREGGNMKETGVG